MRTHEELLALFDDEMRENARPDGPGARVERDGPVVRRSGGPDDWNGVVWSSPELDEEGAEAAVAAQLAHYGALGAALGVASFEWKVYSHDRPAGLADRLGAAGFVPEPPETLMVAAVADLPADAGPPAGVELREVRDEAGVRLMAEAHEAAFGRDASWLRDHMLARLAAAPEEFFGLVAVADGLPVSSARMELYPGTSFAGLWGGGTHPEWRGRGIYRALVAHRARTAAAHGVEYLQVDASADSAPILARLGFTALATTTPYVYRIAS
ncbi:GNAT family N-acetyltransferase [Streptomyces sp. NBC_00102]|uniref:GNAT family N-acetyltransferase n=1 Tax=Streptomyces sp. NBC_00102 TaxID=2975652 RepID=UPI0022530DC9|nr:GNAT family N-acetyltransferase [Streptomyces sp. NBC_00102]MCX5400899.1 GNAT family N-acetyltransferase [Streptomyces sp. NBC_00102]